MLTLDFWSFAKGTKERTLLSKKVICTDQIHVYKDGGFGHLLKVADRQIAIYKERLLQKNPNDIWIRSKQKYSFRYYYKNKFIDLWSLAKRKNVKELPFPTESNIHLRAETVLIDKGKKRNTFLSSNMESYSQWQHHKAKKQRRFVRRKNAVKRLEMINHNEQLTIMQSDMLNRF